MQNFKLLKTEYVSYANVSISGLLNAVGVQPDRWAINTRGTRVFLSESNIYNADRTKMLNANCGLLYLYLHMLGPNAYSKVTLVLEEASRCLKRSQRTVYNNLCILRRKGYINFIEGALDGTYDIFIEYYDDNKFAGKEPGKGFIVVSKDVFDKLICIRDVNTFRFAIRGLLNQVPGKQSNGLNTGCTIKEIKPFFPSYASKKFILNVMGSEAITNIFNISASKSLNYFKVSIKGVYDALTLKRKKLLDVEQEIKRTFDSMNAKYPQNKFLPTQQELRDLSKISLQKPITGIKQAIGKLFANYTRQTVKNMPALVRTLII